jgi:cobyric acid synthase
MPVISKYGEIATIKMKQKSAVEWLVDKLFDPPTLLQEQLQWIEKAKEMERMRITEERAESAINAIQGLIDEYNDNHND